MGSVREGNGGKGRKGAVGWEKTVRNPDGR